MIFLIAVVLACAFAGLAIWALTQLGLDAGVVQIGRAVIIIALVITLLSFLLNGVPEVLTLHAHRWGY